MQRQLASVSMLLILVYKYIFWLIISDVLFVIFRSQSIFLVSSNTHHSSTVVKVLYYKSEGRWFIPSWCQWIFH